MIDEAEDGEAAAETSRRKSSCRPDGPEHAALRRRGGDAPHPGSHPQTQVVVLTTYSDDESIIGALQAGALGYLTKDATRAEIGRAVQAAAAGQAVLDPEVQQRLLLAAARAPAAPPAAGRDPADTDLTPRESEVLRLIAAGKSNREIARAAVRQRGHRQDPCQPDLRQDRLTGPDPGHRYAYTHGYADPRLPFTVPFTVGLRGAPRRVPCRSAVRASSAGARSRRWSTRRT